jgi:hypothetical protein
VSACESWPEDFSLAAAMSTMRPRGYQLPATTTVAQQTQAPHGPAHGDMDADMVVATMKHRHFRESSPHDCALALVNVDAAVVALRLTDAALMIRRRHGLHPTNIDGLRGTIQSQGAQREAVEAVSHNKGR